MADKKVTSLTAVTSVSDDDLFMVVDDPLGTPASKKLTVGALFGSVPSAAVFTQDVTISGDNATVSANTTFSGAGNLILTSVTPTSNHPGLTVPPVSSGSIWFDENYIYVAVNSTTIKRAALASMTDALAPVITITGANPLALAVGVTYVELGASAFDAYDGAAVNVAISGTVDHTTAGAYTITYTATDATGNVATATRTVNVS
tara:strand:+ start:262 stop:873 length:612 start_codon:yes stop_codon:yes gene_type:complete